MATYNPTKTFQHYQLSLVNGSNILMSSKSTTTHKSFRSFSISLMLGTSIHSKLHWFNASFGGQHLELSHDNFEMSYEPDFQSQSHFSSTPFYPSVGEQSFSTPYTPEVERKHLAQQVLQHM